MFLKLFFAEKVIYIHFILNLYFADCTRIQWFSNDPDIDRNASEIISSRGFIPESHTVVTTDGYILTVFRIINPYLQQNRTTNLRPIYLQHGLFGNSDDFLLNRVGFLGSDGIYIEGNNLVNNCTANDPNLVATTLGFVLSACGYDVWLGNNRGNRYSKRHILLDPDIGDCYQLVYDSNICMFLKLFSYHNIDTKYWSFTVDHLSAYDVTAVISYILKVTNEDSIGYIGHSLGTTMMFQLLSTQTQYSNIIKPFIALAPVAYVGSVEALIMRIGALFESILSSVSAPFFGISTSALATIDRFFARFICGNSMLTEFCELFIFSLTGFDVPNTNQSRIPAIVGHFPDGTSTLILAHLAQRVDLKNFAFYNYGKLKNSKVYGRSTPPNYNLSAITSKNIILISGVNDFLADPTDMDKLRSQLKVRIYDDYVIPYTLWNHADFLIGLNAGKFQNSRILKLLKNFD